jgi:Sulfotransferase family
LPREKELHYFDERLDGQNLGSKLLGGRPPDRRWRRQAVRQIRSLPTAHSLEDIRWSARYLLVTPSDRWYLSLFAPGQGRVTGEITPAYSLLDAQTVARVRQLLPDAKILFLMRNPVERAWSHALMEVGRPGARSDRRSDDLLRHFESEGSRLRTDYARTLDIWSAEYGQERVFAGFLEDVHFHPERLLRAVCTFLTIEEPASWPSSWLS